MTNPDLNAAIDAARGTVQREHRYTTNAELLISKCSCGVEAPTVDIGRHIEAKAQAAADQVRAQLLT